MWNRYKYYPINISILVFIVSFNIIRPQINTIQLDLSNEYIYRTYNDTISPTRDIYKQNYMLRTDGYLFHPKLMTFNIKTDVFLLSDSKIDDFTEKRLDSKNFSFYDLTVSLLPKQNTNLTFYSMLKRSERNEEVLDRNFSILPVRYTTDTKYGRTGLTIKQSSRNKFPDIIITGNILSAKNDSSTIWKRNILDVKLLNKDQIENVSYSLNYKLYDYDRNYRNINDIKYEIDVITNAELAESSNLSIRGKYLKYNNSDNLIGDLRHFYNPSKMVYNDLSIRLNQFKYAYGENISYKLQNRIRFDNNKVYKLRFSINYNYRVSDRNSGTSINETSYFKPELIINKQNDLLNFHGVINHNLGLIKNDSERGVTHNTIGNFRITTNSFKKVRISLTENIGYFSYLNNMEMIRIKSGAELLLNLSYRLSAGGFITLENTKYYSSNLNGYTRVLLKNIINTQITKNLRIKFENYYSFNYSENLNDIIRNRLTISESGIINNAVLHMTAEQITIGNTYSRNTVNAGVSYRIFNFIITGGYWINSANNLRFDEYRILIRRPIGFKF